MWFQLIISARTFYMASLPEKDAEEDRRDVGLTISSNGRAYLLQSVDPGAVEFRRLTELNFRGVEVVDRPVKPPSNFFHAAAAAAFSVQFFDAITKIF